LCPHKAAKPRDSRRATTAIPGSANDANPPRLTSMN
jgi:hypothetical protein